MSHLLRKLEAEIQLGYYVPIAEIEAYEKTKDAAWEAIEESDADGMSFSCTNVFEHDACNPSESWLRLYRAGLVSSDRRKILKSSLLKRAISNVPRWDQIARDVEGKFRLYRRGIISEQHWNVVDQAQVDLKAELEFIQFEAECIEEGWGEYILKNAVMLYKYQKEKESQKKARELAEKLKDKELRQQQRLLEHEQLLKKQKQEKQQRTADKIAEALLQAETSVKMKQSLSSKKSWKDS